MYDFSTSWKYYLNSNIKMRVKDDYEILVLIHRTNGGSLAIVDRWKGQGEDNMNI